MGRGHKRAASESDADISKKLGFGAMTEDRFRALYKDLLVDESLTNLVNSHPWSSITTSLDLPEALLLSTVKDQLLAFFYVLQPPGVEAQLYLQIWEIIKTFLGLQAGAGTGGGQVLCAAVLGEQDGEPNDVFKWRDDDCEHAVPLGYEASLTGGKATGRSEFVLVRAPANQKLPVSNNLNVVTEGATPLLVGEVKPGERYRTHIWQPLAFALELMEKCTAPPESMWVFLTDADQWEFVRVNRVSRSVTGEGAAAAGAVAAGAAAAGPVAAGAAAAGPVAAGATAAGAAAVAGAAAGAASAGASYSFTRFTSLHTAMDDPNTQYLQLLAILHHIIYPGQRLADLPERIERSRQALEARAEQWVQVARIKFRDDMAKMQADMTELDKELRTERAQREAERVEREAERAEREAERAEREAERAQMQATIDELQAALARKGGGQAQAS